MLSLVVWNIRCGPQVKMVAYGSFVRPHLEYASSLWDPHQKCLIDKFEGVQNYAVRFIFKQYSRGASVVTEMKASIGIKPLDCRWKEYLLKLMHAIYNNSSRMN